MEDVQELIVQYNMEKNADYTANLALFADVSNSKELRELIVQGRLEAALINASMILDPFHVVVAGHKALHLFLQGKMKTRTLHSEIIFNLSPSSNINDSFKKFGILDNTRDILVVIITQGSGIEKVSELSKQIKGTMVSLTSQAAISDEEKIQKIYGISDKELQCNSLESGIITRIAIKDAS